jgi:hypothetical protein
VPRARTRHAALLALLLVVPGCGGAGDESPGELADVVEVAVVGTPGRYRFEVTVRSRDEGCERYADWWEVVTPEGELLFRRLMARSHVDDNPFTAPGGPVAIGEDDPVVVRAHMKPSGYGGVAFRGSPRRGFRRWKDAPQGFAAGLETHDPIPKLCLF